MSRLLEEVASRIGGRTVRYEDGNVYLIRLPSRVGRGEVWWGRGVGIDIPGGSSLSLLIGKARVGGGYPTTLLEGEQPPLHYAPEFSSQELVRAWLDSGGREAMRALPLDPADQVHVYRNGVTASLYRARTPSAVEVAAFVEALAAFVRTLPPPPKERPPQVPASFAEVQPFARRWAVSDDHERATDLGRARDATLRRLVDTVRPRLGEINQVLDAAGEPLSDELVDLQAIAQAAIEAELELEERSRRRRGTPPRRRTAQ